MHNRKFLIILLAYLLSAGHSIGASLISEGIQPVTRQGSRVIRQVFSRDFSGIPFITSRIFNEGNQLTPNRIVTFDLENSSPTKQVHFCERIGKRDYREVGSELFIEQVRELSAQHVVFYIHGFNNVPEEGDSSQASIFKRAELMQAGFDRKSPGLVQLIPVIWPCAFDKWYDTTLGRYSDDKASSRMTATPFARGLKKFLDKREAVDVECRKTLHVIAHSMGNRVLREMLAELESLTKTRKPVIFGSALLAAADIANESLSKGERGSVIPRLSRNVAVYYAGDDKPLRYSPVHWKNWFDGKRLGYTGPEGTVARNVYAVDCDSVNDDLDDSMMDHAYFVPLEDESPNPVFDHMYDVITTGRVRSNDRREWIIE